MFCEQCGKSVSDYAKYCRHCGAKLEYYKLAREQMAQQAAAAPESAPDSGEESTDADAPIEEAPLAPEVSVSLSPVSTGQLEATTAATAVPVFSPPVMPTAPVRRCRRWPKLIVLAVVCLTVMALVYTGLWFWLFGAQQGLETELARDWTQVYTQEGVTYVVHLDFDGSTMRCHYEAGNITEQLNAWDYEIVSDDRIALLDDSGTVISITFNDNRNRMTLSPGCLNGSDTEHWYNFES